MENVRFTLAGGDSMAQLAHEIQGKQREDRERLLEEIRQAGGNFHVNIPVASALAMKADLNIP